MRRLMVQLVAVVLAAQVAWAQGPGGGGKGPDGGGKGPDGGGKGQGGGGNGNGNGGGHYKREEEKPVPWASSYDEAVKAAGDQKYILMYVYNPAETKDPSCFSNPDVVTAGTTGGWVFVKKEFAKDDADLKRLKITTSGVIIGLDRYTNDFKQRGQATLGDLQAILKNLPPIVVSFKAKIAGEWAQAQKALDDQAEEKAIKPMTDIVTTGKRGYKEIVDSIAKIREIGDKRIKDAEALIATDEPGFLKAMKGIIDTFKSTTAAAAAETRLARYEREHDGLASAIARLLKVLKYEDEMYKPEVEVATKVIDEIVAEGTAFVDAAAKFGAAGEVEKAKDRLRQIAKDYKGSSVELRANEALKVLSQ